jgi:hypothetical protein
VAVAAICSSSVSSSATDMRRHILYVHTWCVRGRAVLIALVLTVCTQNNGLTKDWVYVQNKEAVSL